MIYDEDWVWLEQNYGAHSDKPVGVGTMVKKIVHTYVVKLREAVVQLQDEARAGAGSDD